MALNTFLISPDKNRKYLLNGVRPSTRLPTKEALCQVFRDHLIYSADDLPPKTDLREHMTSVEDQSKVGSCTANSIAGAYEYLAKKGNGLNVHVSRLFIYYNSRIKENKDQDKHGLTDSGCTMTYIIETLEELGTCIESIWPYDISKVNQHPSNDAYEQAQIHQITEAFKMNIDLHEMKSCLAHGFPFLFGLKLFSSFDQASRSGVVPMPSASDLSRQSDGNHALLAVGYSDQSQSFIVRNSWGEKWGDRGYCYIPYDYITNSDFCFDVWNVRKVATADFGQDHWDHDDLIDYRKMDNSDNDNNDSNPTIEHFDEADE